MTDRTRTLALMAASLYPVMVSLADDDNQHDPPRAATEWAIDRAIAILAEVEHREAQQATGNSVDALAKRALLELDQDQP